MFSFQGIFEVCHRTPHSKIFSLCFFFKLIIWTFLGASNVYWVIIKTLKYWRRLMRLHIHPHSLFIFYFHNQLEFLIQTILKCYSIFTQYIIKVSSPLIRVIKHANFVSSGLSLEWLSLLLYDMTYFSSLFIYSKANSSAPSSPQWWYIYHQW